MPQIGGRLQHFLEEVEDVVCHAGEGIQSHGLKDMCDQEEDCLSQWRTNGDEGIWPYQNAALGFCGVNMVLLGKWTMLMSTHTVNTTLLNT